MRQTSNGRRAWRRTIRSHRKHDVHRQYLGPDTKARSQLRNSAAYFRRHQHSFSNNGRTIAEWTGRAPVKLYGGQPQFLVRPGPPRDDQVVMVNAQDPLVSVSIGPAFDYADDGQILRFRSVSIARRTS